MSGHNISSDSTVSILEIRNVYDSISFTITSSNGKQEAAFLSSASCCGMESSQILITEYLSTKHLRKTNKISIYKARWDKH